MTVLDEVCFWSADIVPLLTTLATFIYGVKNFFKKGKAFYLQIVTMAMGCKRCCRYGSRYVHYVTY